MLCCKNGRSRSLRRGHKRRGASLGMRTVFPNRGFLPDRKPRFAHANPSAQGNSRHSQAPHARRRGHHSSRRVKPCNSRVRKSSSAASRKKASTTSSAIPAARSQHLRRAVQAGKVKHVLVRHEQGAVHAADGYSRSSHKTGVALVTSGPGVTNAVTGIATAYMDSIPMVVITGQVPTHAIGQDAFQECDTVGITRPCVKHNFLVKDVKDLAVDDQEGVLPGGTGPARTGAGRHSQGRDAGEDRVQLSEDRVAALVQSGHQGARRTDQEGGPAPARREAADGLRRRRRGPQQRVVAVDAARAAAGFPVHEHADGPGRLPRHRSAVHRHAGHARHLRIEHGDAALRRADRHRRALRRPRDRQSRSLLPHRPQDHPHRHRPVVDLQAREGGRADRRLCRRRARRNAEAHRVLAAAARPGGAEGLVGRHQGVAAQGLPEVRHEERRSSSRSS